MRISVGHILIVAGVGSYLALGPLRSLNFGSLGTRLQPLRDSITGYLGRSNRNSQNQDTTVPLTMAEPASAASESDTETLTAQQTDQAPVVIGKSELQKQEGTGAPASSEPEISAASPKLSKAKKGRRRRVKRSAENIAPVGTAVTTSPAPRRQKSQKSSRATSKDPLVGSYVSLELTSGREVKGLLQDKTATEYKIELPGMGPFSYPIQNVKSVRPAE